MSRITGLTRLGMVVLLAAAPIAGAAVLPAPAAQAQSNSAVVQTKEITNYGRGTSAPATVRVDRTTNLFDRQQVTIDLNGFKPSYNANNINVGGSRVEYPVVVMLCRGAKPARNTCVNQDRVQWQSGFDVNALPEQRAVAEKQSRQGEAPAYPGADIYQQYANLYRAEQLPFVSTDGVSYLWVANTIRPDGQPSINEPKLKSFPPPDTASEGTSVITTRYIPIRPNGTNKFLFEVRQRASQPSLGCTDTQQCSIVVVPIMDMACAQNAPAECAAGPNGPAPGDGGFTDGHNLFVGPQQWLAESNWRNRFVVPISFAPDLQSCDVRDPRPSVQAYGSELVDVAQQRWGAAYCTGARKSDYLPVYTQGSEYFARRQLTTRLGTSYQQDAVFVSQPVTGSPRPVVHAPSALTGFAVAYVVDDANGKQVQNLTLSPRLLAKLLTQSYNPVVVPPNIRQGKQRYTGTQPVPDDATANGYYVAHPALIDNPRSLFADPEFAALNPGLAVKDQAGNLAPQLLGTLNSMIFTVESDIIMDVTRYITSDPATRAWLGGQADQYGMRVNPAWRNLAPTQIYTLLDTWVRPSQPRKTGWLEGPFGDKRFFVYGGGDTCDETFKTPYLTKMANVSNSAEADALALLDRRGSATPVCTSDSTPVPPAQQAPGPQFPGDDVTQDVVYREVKNQPADFGQRAVLAVTTVPHAALYEVPTARLVNSAGKAVGPTPGTMLNALNAAVQDPASGTVRIDHPRVTGNAYPGTMVAYTAVPTAGLNRATAGRYADFIEFMATTGQVPGPTLANLPPGYDPLPPAMVNQAKAAAAAIRAQRGEVPPPPPGGPLQNGMPPGFGGGDQPVAQAPNPGSGLPAGAVQPQGAAKNPKVTGDPARVAKTEGASSWLARWAMPLLIGFGLLAALVAFGVQVGSRPDHPLRRRLDGLLRAVGRR
ncbi:hypothetical protein [Actinophytocola sp.]|uniref:hypothetical protein n=1 Tax=Actinophytocola sp. TaxID=1872138 RepID=UPI002EDA6CFE